MKGFHYPHEIFAELARIQHEMLTGRCTPDSAQQDLDDVRFAFVKWANCDLNDKIAMFKMHAAVQLFAEHWRMS